MLRDEITKHSYGFSLKAIKFFQKFDENERHKLQELITIITHIGAQIHRVANMNNKKYFILAYQNAIVGLNKVDIILSDLHNQKILPDAEFLEFYRLSENLKSEIIVELNNLLPDILVKFYSLNKKLKYLFVVGKISLKKK